LEGDSNSDTYDYIEIEILACDETLSTCKTRGMSPGVGLTESVATGAFKKVRKMIVEMNFVEGVSDVEDYENPIKLHINTNYKFNLDIYQEKFITFYYIPFTMETTTGEFWDNTSTKTSISLDKTISDSTTRDPGATFQKPGQTETRSSNYINIKLASSNK